MNLTTSQLQALSRGQKIRPCFNLYCNIGQEIALQLKPIRSLREAGRDLGMTPQAVHAVSCVALGKIAWALRGMLKEECRMQKGDGTP